MYGTGTWNVDNISVHIFSITGADLYKDDGIYSANFGSFNADGRYTVQVFMPYQDGYSNIIYK